MRQVVMPDCSNYQMGSEALIAIRLMTLWISEG